MFVSGLSCLGSFSRQEDTVRARLGPDSGEFPGAEKRQRVSTFTKYISIALRLGKQRARFVGKVSHVGLAPT